MNLIKAEKYSISLYNEKENILRLEIFEDCILDSEDVLSIYEGYIQLSPDKDYSVIVYGQSFSSITKEGKVTAADRSHKGLEHRKKVALISTNASHILIINFYVLWNKPKAPIKVFKTEEDALAWLKE